MHGLFGLPDPIWGDLLLLAAIGAGFSLGVLLGREPGWGLLATFVGGCIGIVSIMFAEGPMGGGLFVCPFLSYGAYRIGAGVRGIARRHSRSGQQAE
jgi:hypothetical protein